MRYSANEINEAYTEIANGLACAHLRYSAYPMVRLPDGILVTRTEYWDSLSPAEQETRMREAFAVVSAIENVGPMRVFAMSQQMYLDEK